MKNGFPILIALFCSSFAANAANLIEVYQQALYSDPIYQQAISQRLATKEGVPISLAALLPTLAITANPALTRSGFSGSNVAGTNGYSPRNITTRSYELALTATQTVFNYTQFVSMNGAIATSKGADATLNAALQSLMTRVANAYFAILRAEDNLKYSDASQHTYAEQLSQARQQQKVGLKTITDVYTAEAAYDLAVANYIAAQTTLANAREDLRVITGIYYPRLSSLSEDFPLITPHPVNIDAWVHKAQSQNWSIKASEYAVDTARQAVRQQFGGHLPTVSVQGQLDRIYTNNINGYPTISQRNGPNTETDRQIMLNINVPLFEGGGVTAQTNQATYNYQIAQQQLEQTVRSTVNTTRQSYLNVLSDISQILADKKAIKSSMSSLEGMEESYKVGNETLVNVLNQQQKLYRAQTEYTADRYHFVSSVLALKQAAGTLSFDDLRAINAWLIDQHHVVEAKQHHTRIIKKTHLSHHTKKKTPHKKHIHSARRHLRQHVILR